MARRTSETDTARVLEITTKTLSRYREARPDREPVPHDLVNGRPFYTPSEVRAWQEKHGLTGQRGATVRPVEDPPAPVAPPPPVTPPDAGVRQGVEARQNLAKADLAAKVSKAQLTQMALQAEKGLGELGLDVKLRAAKTNDDLARLALEVGALVSTGKLTPDRGRAINDLIKEARQHLKAQAKAPEQVFDRALLATAEAVDLVRNFEGIVAAGRREKVLRYVEVMAEEDRMESPALDTVAPDQDRAE